MQQETDLGPHEKPGDMLAWGSQAVLDVVAERRRQIEVEGWTPEHDDEHSWGQMARAGAAYAAQSLAADDAELECGPPPWWPWDRKWWKPTSRRRMLVKACALILAEIERLDRMTPNVKGNWFLRIGGTNDDG